MASALAVLENQLAPLRPHFSAVLPKSISPDRLIRTVMISVEKLPQLLDCDRQSLFNAAMSAAVLGLEVDGVTGQAYLIPFRNKAQLVIGYKGLTTLAARSGITITGGVVREGDLFEFELGSNAFVRHVPQLGSKGRIIAAYASATSKARPAVVCVLDIGELMAVKDKSPGARRSDSPWNDQAIGFPAMCEKTAKRRLARSLPLNIMQLAAKLDEAVDEQGQPAWISPDKSVVLDGDVIPPRQDSRTPTAQELIEPLGEAITAAEWDLRLADAAKEGTTALKALWRTIPEEHRTTLDAALQRRHKPTAEQADAPQSDEVKGCWSQK